jgi:mono/diheme cytochrome c family protein
MRLSLNIAALLVGGLLSHPSAADEPGDADRGRKYALQMCASCHAVQLQDSESPVAEATPFKMIADRPEMTRLALRVFFQSPHPSMPNLMVEDEDAVRGERPIGRAKLCSP